MKCLLPLMATVILTPCFVLADYGTPAVATARSIQPWIWDEQFIEMNNLRAAEGDRGYDIDESDEYHDTVLDLQVRPTIDELVSILQEGPGWIGAILHGGANYDAQAGPVGVFVELACFPFTGAGKAARNIMLNDANTLYGRAEPWFHQDKCYSILLDASVYGAYFNSTNRTGALFAACNGMQVLPLLLPGAQARAGYAADEPAPTTGCTDYALVFNAMTGHEGWDPDYVPKTLGGAVSTTTNGLQLVSGDDGTLQIVPWMVSDSTDENGDVATSEGLDFWIEVRGEVPHNPAVSVITSDSFQVEIPYWSWNSLVGVHELHATIKPLPGLEFESARVLIDCDLVPSANCADLVLNGTNDNQIYFNIENGDNPAADVGGFSVVGGVARWTAIPFRTSKFVIDAGEDPLDGPWQELLSVVPHPATADYSACLAGHVFPWYRLTEVETTGRVLIHRRASARSMELDAPRASFDLEPASLASKLAQLARGRAERGVTDPQPWQRGAGDAVVMFTRAAWEDTVLTHVADYWQTWWGYEVFIETVNNYPTPDPGIRDAWRAHMKDRIAFYYNQHGVRYVHFIGGANDWELWSQEWPGEWAEIKDTYIAQGYPAEGQPALDHIPMFYVVDDQPRGQNTAWWTWWIATDAPYKDVDGDGSPDVALGRWPVNSGAEILAWAATMQQYNDSGVVDDVHVIELWTGELYYDDDFDTERILQAAAALEAEMPAGMPVTYMHEADYPDIGVRNLEAAQRLNIQPEITVLAMVANDSHRRYPCKQFDNRLIRHLQWICSFPLSTPPTCLLYPVGRRTFSAPSILRSLVPSVS